MQFSCLNTVYVRLNDKSSCAVTQIPCLHRSALQTDRLDFLYVARNKVDGLVAPFHVIAFDIKHDTLDRLLARQLERLTIFSNCYLQFDFLCGWEVDILKRLRPVSFSTTMWMLMSIPCDGLFH